MNATIRKAIVLALLAGCSGPSGLSEHTDSNTTATSGAGGTPADARVSVPNGGSRPASPPAAVIPAEGSFDAASLYECQARAPRDPGCETAEAALPDGGSGAAVASCRWLVGTRDLEGRCLSPCFADSHPLGTFLSQGSCDEGQLCTPCFNPVDGSATGACSLAAGDAPLDPPPPTFENCGAPPATAPAGPDGGICVPADLAAEVDNAAIPFLTQLECRPGEICAPTLKVHDPLACFAPCETRLAELLGDRYLNGGCVPSYVVALVAPAGVGVLEQGACAAGELCAPCLNPLAADAPTGACQ
jgi:hypothetical protein